MDAQDFRRIAHVSLGGNENFPDVVRLHLNGPFWGVYIAFESPNSAWVRKHGLDEGTEIYKSRSVSTPGLSKNADLFRNHPATPRPSPIWSTRATPS